MKRGNPPPGYYSASEAKKKLGNISDGMLRNYVQKGRVERFVPPERSQGFYKREDVDRLAEALRSYLEPSAVWHFQRITDREDLVECARIAKQVYGSEGTPIETRLAWLAKNPELLYVVKSDHIAGYTYLLPLKRETIDAILREETSLQDLTADDIESFTSGNTVDIYLMSVAMRPSLSKQERRILSSQIISGLMNVLLDLGKRGVIIRAFLARSRFPEGKRLLKGMGFSEYPVQSPDERFSYFILEVDRSNALFIRRYKRALQNNNGGRGQAHGDH